MGNGSEDWYDLPRPAAGIRLYRSARRCGRRTSPIPRSRLSRPQRRRPEAMPTTCGPATAPTTISSVRGWAAPACGSAATCRLSEAFPDTANLLTPSPRRVSLELLTRTTFQPATILNVIAAAWIQFMVHDWFVHKKGTWEFTHDIPLDDGDTWHERPMRVPKTPAEPPKVAGVEAAARLHQREHALVGRFGRLWQQPGSQASLRAGREGKVLVSPSGRLGIDPVTGREITGFTENGWVGLSLLHGLFALEHNAICDHLKKHNPIWDDERLFQQARLINSALLAKIHTTEWSTAILPRDVLSTGLQGELARQVQQAAERVSQARRQRHLLRDSRVSDRTTGVPFSLTEEFVSVYRMHPLMPDHFTISSAETGQGLRTPSCPSCPGSAGWSSFRGSTSRICSTRSGPTIRARCGCTTIRNSCRTWCRTTATGSTSPPSTSFATASAACRVTTGSVVCSTRRPSGASRS